MRYPKETTEPTLEDCFEKMGSPKLFDPVCRAREVEKLVMDGDKRRYYRFRHAKFYGGINTADAVGCCLLCAYCWNYEKNENPTTGDLFSAEEVANKLIKLAEKNDCWKFRISGCEPFLGEASTRHLYKVIKIISSYNSISSFIIESNGLMVGYDPSLLDDIPKLSISRLKLRICLKAENEAQSQQITGARGAFDLQMKGIKAISEKRLNLTVATMPNFVKTVDLPPNAARETERLKVYGAKDRLKGRGL